MKTNTQEEKKEIMMTLVKVFSFWSMETAFNPDKVHTRNQEVYDGSFICKVIDKRLKAFKIDVVIPDYLILIIDVCSGGNPGQAQMILSEILESIPDLKAGHVITPIDFARAYGKEFPVARLYPEVNERLSKRWDAQKMKPLSPWDTDNQCDYPEYWMKFFK